MSIITCGWKPLGASYRQSFDDMIFNGKHCVLKRLIVGYASTIDTNRITMYLDCRCFHNEESYKFTPHLGHHIRILELIAGDKQLPQMFRETIATLKEADREGTPADMVLVCTSGIHRAPAVAYIIFEMCKRDGREMNGYGPRRLSKNTDKWLRKCNSCSGCNADESRRKALFDQLYVELWAPLLVPVGF